MTARRSSDLKFYAGLAILAGSMLGIGAMALPASAVIKHPIERDGR